MNPETGKICEPFLDSVGNPILKGDLVRMYHFTGARKKRHFMYKIAGDYNQDKGITYVDFKDVHSSHSFNVTSREKSQKLLNQMLVVSREKFSDDPLLENLKRNKKLSD